MKVDVDKELVVLSRDVFAMLVPSGARVMLQKGSEVTITQALGASFTVDVYGNLARIDGRDADALGKEVLEAAVPVGSNATLEERVWAQLKTVYDPEIPVNIVDLGLVYACRVIPLIENVFRVEVDMTLTAPGCGMGPVIVEDAQRKIEQLPDVEEVEIELVFDPPWDRDKMSDEAKLALGLYG
ncbi:MAG: putative Fe-S cluster assembly protein SufT [Gammaproteobacteria bacterium RIFCSPHIGHO2_12_FULL_45_9]|nr:MAG: putative Fe-S cluster assembly protein SufT [Gammaproteobacteria bacterium RIFCSPHIGHO2_12_FULL_45_9]